MHRATHLSPLTIPGRVIAVILAAAFLLASLAAAPAAQATTRGDGLRAAANERRDSKNVAPVAGTALLDRIADARADQMRDADRMEHDIGYVVDKLNAAGACWRSVGEIIAYNWDSPFSYRQTVTQWWNSPTHHDIMTSPDFNAAGGSFATTSAGRNYAVMIFVKLCAEELSTTSLLQPRQVYSPARSMVFTRGTHVGYRFSSSGAVIGKKTLELSRRSGANSSGRTRVDGKAYLLVSNGGLAGYWVRESRKSFVRGFTQKQSFSPARAITFQAGTYSGFKFDQLGRVTAKRSGTLARASGADAAGRAVINGRRYFLVKNGYWAGYWVRNTWRVNLAR